MKKLTAILPIVLLPSVATAQTVGNLTEEHWNNVSGFTVKEMKEAMVSRVADTVLLRPAAEAPQNTGSNYGRRMRGTITVPATGSYTFYIAGDNEVELWLSSDHSGLNKKRIAYHKGYTAYQQWDRYATQQSEILQLEAGQEYFIEALQKESSGGDNLSIGWRQHTPETLIENSIGAGVSATWTVANEEYQASVVAGEIWGSNDSCAYQSRVVSGDFVAVARVKEMNNPYHWAKAGLMLRTGLADNAIQVSMLRSGANGMAFQGRTTEAGGTYHSGYAQQAEWVKLERRGNVVSGYVSTDKKNWIYVDRFTIADLAQDLEIGLVATCSAGSDTLEVTFSDLSIAATLASEVIPSENLSSFVADPADADDNGLADAWEAQQQLTGSAWEVSQYGDPDNDGLTNLEEAQLGTDPKVPSAKPGYWMIEKWRNVSSYEVAELVKHDKFFADADVRELVPTNSQKVTEQYEGQRLRGYITAPESGMYTFWVSATNGAELWLSTDDTKYRKEFLAGMGPRFGTGHGITSTSSNLWDQYASQMSHEVYLEAGQKYYCEALTQQGHTGYRHISLAWARPGQDREFLPMEYVSSYAGSLADADDDYLPDAWESQFGLDPADNGGLNREHEGENGDFDMDGLSNREEYVAGTDPSNPDSDGDGITDGDELKSYGTDPNTSDAPSETLVHDIDVASYTSADVDWTSTSEGLISSSFRGGVEWSFTVPADGYWTINISTKLLGDLYLNEQVPASVFIDGQKVWSKNVPFGQQREALLRVTTPYLTAGQHSVKLFVDNMLARRSVAIKSVAVYKPEGLDANNDGHPDWIFSQLAGQNTLFPYQTNSRTSPVFIEGSARVPANVDVNALDAKLAADTQGWYADITLADTGSTDFLVDLEQGIAEAGSVTWVETNILDNESLTVRLGDSLKLSAQPAGVSTGQPVAMHFSGTNWARHAAAVATQSTTYPGGLAEEAIDGSTDTADGISHTDLTSENWWQVDLGAERTIERVVLWNRATHQNRLANYQVQVLDDQGAVLVSQDFHTDGSSHTGTSEEWLLDTPVNGQVVKVVSLGNNHQGNRILTFAEVEVFGIATTNLASDAEILVHQFTKAGTQTIAATHADGSTGTLTVHVKQAQFTATTQDLLSNTAGNVVLDANLVDSDLFFDTGDTAALNAVSVSGNNLYLKLLPSGFGEAKLAARLFENGPILGTQSLNLIGISDALQNDLTVSFLNGDFPGYSTVSTPIVATNLPEGGKIKITIFRSGVTFKDGTSVMWVDVDDIVNGVINVDFLFPTGAAGGYCHYMDIYDRNGTYLGRR